MENRHLPAVNARYWAGITLASVFGTNSGDLYAHKAGLGLVVGLVILGGITAICFWLQARDPRSHEAWYWLVIMLIRTGATNIADYLDDRGMPPVTVAVSLVIVLGALALRMHKSQQGRRAGKTLQHTDSIYWFAMLIAGVLGTALGDDISHLIGHGKASVVLGVMLVASLLLIRGSALVIAYWGVVAVARTAGTAMGDFLVHNRVFNPGLPLATALSSTTFVILLYFWSQSPKDKPHQSSV